MCSGINMLRNKQLLQFEGICMCVWQLRFYRKLALHSSMNSKYCYVASNFLKFGEAIVEYFVYKSVFFLCFSFINFFKPTLHLTICMIQFVRLIIVFSDFHCVYTFIRVVHTKLIIKVVHTELIIKVVHTELIFSSEAATRAVL